MNILFFVCFLILLTRTITNSLPLLSQKYPEDEILQTSQKVYNWISSLTKTGKFEKNYTGQNQYDLYSGSSGVIINILEFYKIFLNEEMIYFVELMANDIMNSYESEIATKFDISFFHHGLSGVSFAFHELYKMVNKSEYLNFFKKVDDVIIEKYGKKEMTNNCLRWGSGGTGMYLMYLLEVYKGDKQRYDYILKNLISGAEFLMKRGKKVSDTKMKWYFDGTFGLEMPNYAGGTAGICHFFLKLYNITGDDKYLEIALKGSNYLVSIANTSNDGCLIFFNNSPFEDAKYYLGECNGNSGTGKYWLHLYTVTKDKKWLEFAIKSGKSLIDYHLTNNWWIPKKPEKGFFWNTMSLCDGTSAVIEFLFLLNQYNPDKIYEQTIHDMIDNIFSRRIITDDYVHWEQAEWRVHPKETLSQVGMYQGAGGISNVLLHLIHNEIRIKLPDYTF